ncbi:MAG: chalcone isomerase family protein [Gammaproteobacteria bacterium]|nr:chalcone isomerase family protein [Gammaproteobacteria bacterium]
MLKVAVLILALLASASAIATDEVAKAQWANASAVGEGRLTVMLWDVFDAVLYAPDGQYDSNKPFALSLTYLRKLKGKKIVEKTIKEIRSQGFSDATQLASWAAELHDIIPDVKKGNNITGVRNDQGHTLFFYNAEPVGSIRDEAFTTLFFNIWLGESSSEPGLRKKLLNLGS